MLIMIGEESLKQTKVERRMDLAKNGEVLFCLETQFMHGVHISLTYIKEE